MPDSKILTVLIPALFTITLMNKFNKEYKSIKEPGIKKNHFGQQIRINFSVRMPSVTVFKWLDPLIRPSLYNVIGISSVLAFATLNFINISKTN